MEERATPIPEKKEIPKEVLAKKIEEGEKEIEEIVAKKTEKREEKPAKETKHKEERKEEKPKEEQKGFFARLKDKFIAKEEHEEEKPFETSEEELKEFEEAFKEKEETQKETREKVDEAEEIIPVVTETETGETVFEIQQKPGTKHEEHSEPKVRNALETQKEFQMKRKETAKREEAEVIEEQEEEQKEAVAEEEKEESGFFNALKNTIFKTSLSEEKFEELFWELEMVLLENNVAVEVIELMKQNLKKDLVEKKILRGEINDIILRSLQKSVEQTFDVPTIDFIEKVKEKKPFVVVFVGINGSGKTTTIAKMANKLKENNLSCVIAAGDTFRAAAIQQLEEHANRLHIKMIKHDYGSDPAAVGFDAIKYAQAHNIDCVLIDTAGRVEKFRARIEKQAAMSSKKSKASAAKKEKEEKNT